MPKQLTAFSRQLFSQKSFIIDVNAPLILTSEFLPVANTPGMANLHKNLDRRTSDNYHQSGTAKTYHNRSHVSIYIYIQLSVAYTSLESTGKQHIFCRPCVSSKKCFPFYWKVLLHLKPVSILLHLLQFQMVIQFLCYSFLPPKMCILIIKIIIDTRTRKIPFVWSSGHT